MEVRLLQQNLIFSPSKLVNMLDKVNYVIVQDKLYY